MEAALGIAQLEEREELCRRRQEIAACFNDRLAEFEDELQLPRARPESEHDYMFYPLVLRSSRVRRRDLILYLEENRIETRYLLPLINQPIYQKLFGVLDQNYPVAARLNENAFYIGCHPEMTDDDVDYVVDRFGEFFRGARS